MASPTRHRSVVSAAVSFGLGLVAIGLPPDSRAFVFLNTSSETQAADSARAASEAKAAAPAPVAPHPSPDAAPVSRGAPAVPAAPADSATRGGKPHYGNLLFLGADNRLVYAYVGVLKALEAYDVRVDAILAESKAVAVGASWALGYGAKQMEQGFARHPLEKYLRPYPVQSPVTERFAPYGPDPAQVDLTLNLQTLQALGVAGGEAAAPDAGEFLHLAWMIARLTHDAPAGPVENLRDTPRHLAVQVTDLADGEAEVVTEGNLQDILKGSLLPRKVLRQRPHLWHYAPGDLASGESVLADRLPFTFDHLLIIEPGRHLQAPLLEASDDPWSDSLAWRLRAKPVETALAGAGKLLRVELQPEAGFDPQSADPQAWIDLGYTSALRCMDMLLAAMGSGAPSAPSAPQAAPFHKLNLGRASYNSMASGGKDLLLDLVKKAEEENADTTGETSIGALMQSGYYSDLDVEWANGPGEERAFLVFDAKEQSRLSLRAGADAAFDGEALPNRGPEIGAALTWNEPFYVPFRAEAAGILGGHRPGYKGKALVAPVYPLPLELGISSTHWEIHYPESPETVASLYPLPVAGSGSDIRLTRDLTRVFLHLAPQPNVRLATAVERQEFTLPADQFPDGDFPDGGDFSSTNFEQSGLLGLGKPGASGLYRQSLWLRYRNLNPVNLFGPVKKSTSVIESRLRLSLGDFRFLDQYYWSNQLLDESSSPDEFFQAGEVAAFSFQDEYFSRLLRSVNFQNVQAEYAPVFGKAGLRVIAGALHHYGPYFPLLSAQAHRPTRGYWEIQGVYSTLLGPFRAGLASLAGEKPMVFVRLGADLSLEDDAPP